jgi:hypothetical protein
MKTLITILAVFINIGLLNTAQAQSTFINYQGVAGDGSGTIMANTGIAVQIALKFGTATNTASYIETHSVTTDANGVFSLQIGNGTAGTGVYNELVWAEKTFATISIDGSEIGTTELHAVPYALHAANITGLEALDEGNGIGWRLKGRDPTNYGNIGLNATDLSFSSTASTTHGATGFASTAMGLVTNASGDYSTAMGRSTTASGLRSTAMGRSTTASGDRSSAMGNSTTASGFASTAMGSSTTASGVISTAMGSITIASGTYSTAMGRSTIASEIYSTAMGWSTIASGVASTAMGVSTEASGNRSTAMGFDTEASGFASTAMGNSTTASGEYSTAIGYFTTASGDRSTAMGFDTEASGFASTAIGRFNIGGGNLTTWILTDPLFEVGNGTNNRSNALTILKNGKVGIGTATPSVKLHITGGTDATLTNGSGYIVLGNETGQNIVLDNNEIMARNNGAASTLFLQRDGGPVWVGGSVVHASDKRLKKDIEPLHYGLNEVLQLQPKTYNWKNRTQDHKSFGLIAQEVQPLIKELVLTAEDKNKTLSLNYIALIPILINAIQEQQEIIETLTLRIKKLEGNTQQLAAKN